MLPSSTIQSVPVYASQNQAYVQGPTQAEQEAGMVPLDTVPADWWNYLFKQLSERVNQTVVSVQNIFAELLNILAAVQSQPSELETNQIVQAIIQLQRQNIGTTAVTGSVKSSTSSGKVAIDNTGVMTPNGLGTPTSLNTTSKVVVEAINEILSSLTTLGQTLSGQITSLGTDKAPNNHASTATTYGTGTASNYGHVKLSDSTSSTSGEGDGIAATPAAVKAAYDLAQQASSGMLGNNNPQALGTASAGSATVASREDHVHPMPVLVTTGGVATAQKVDFTYASATNTLTITTTGA